MNYYKKNNDKIDQLELEPLSKVILYDDKSTSNLILDELRDYLASKFNNLEISVRNDFFSYYLDNQNNTASKDGESEKEQNNRISGLARQLAGTKVRDLNQPGKFMEPLLGEIRFEEKILNNPSKAVPGIFYDGFKLHELFQELLPNTEINKTIYHIIFTHRLFGTFDQNDKRYHARVILCGYPSIISTTGIVEAPAKPKEYYQIKQGLIQQNISTIDDFVPKELKQKYLKYNDQKITEMMKGYVMQAIFYHLTSEPFCSDPKCRLFNAHWQEELLQAQASKPEFCEKHQEILNRFNM